MILSKGILINGPWIEPQVGPGVASLPPGSAKTTPFGGNVIFRQESIKALLRTLSARDPYTGHHSNRVTDIALKFGRSLNLPPQDLETLTNVAYLHDIGKIGVSDSILLKAGPLTPEERAIIETHPLIGERIVEPLGFKSQERALILLHHEHWNGQGYPHGLQGTNIPFLCRLLALADVFDALSSDRPYRRAFPPADALAEIEAQAGRQFDPELTSKFVHLVRNLEPSTFSQVPHPPWLEGGTW